MASKEKGGIDTSGKNYECDEEKQKKIEEGHNNSKPEHSYKEQYLVRGAILKCNCGSHTRGVNLPIDHGSKALGNPVLHEMDCRVGDEYNITSFGVCKSETPPENSETVLLKAVYTEEDKKNKKPSEMPENVKGKLCTPMIIGNWMDTKEDSLIKDNETDNKYPAVSTYSFLVCACGGIIEPQTSGQECNSSEDIKVEE